MSKLPVPHAKGKHTGHNLQECWIVSSIAGVLASFCRSAVCHEGLPQLMF